MVGDVDADRCAPAEPGGGRCSPAALLQIGNDIGVETIELGRRQVGLLEPEADDVERHRRQKFEVAMRTDAFAELLRQAAILLDRPAQPPGAVLLEREPDLERAKAARQLRAEVAEPGLAAGETALPRRPIMRVHGEGGMVAVDTPPPHP